MLVKRCEKNFINKKVNAFIFLLLKNQENTDMKAVAKSCQLCSAVEYFRVFSFSNLNFQVAADVPESPWVFWEVLECGWVFQTSMLFPEFCHDTGLESICVSITCCLLLNSHSKLLLRIPQLGFLPQAGQCSKKPFTLLSCHFLLKMDKIASYRTDLNE